MTKKEEGEERMSGRQITKPIKEVTIYGIRYVLGQPDDPKIERMDMFYYGGGIHRCDGRMDYGGYSMIDYFGNKASAEATLCQKVLWVEANPNEEEGKKHWVQEHFENKKVMKNITIKYNFNITEENFNSSEFQEFINAVKSGDIAKNLENEFPLNDAIAELHVQ